MKVFLATLLIVGLAAALPPFNFVKNLKTKLQKDVQDITTHTKQLVEQVSTHTKEVVEAVAKDPLAALGPLTDDLSIDVKKLVDITFSDANNLNEQVQSALKELSKMDAAPLKDILQNLKQQLNGDSKDVQATVQQLLQQARDHVVEDAKVAIVDPKVAAKLIQDNLNMDYNQFVSESKKYAATVQKQVQDSIAKLNQ